MFDYIFYVERNYRKALELASEAVKSEKTNDWWWKERFGKCYYQLGMYRDSEKQLMASLQLQPTVNAYYLLSQIYIKLDQPMNTITILGKALDLFPKEPTFHLALGRVYELLNEADKSFGHYKDALALENNNIEVLAVNGGRGLHRQPLLLRGLSGDGTEVLQAADGLGGQHH